MSEGVLGFAKLLLSADSSQLKKGIEEAKAHARSMGKTMADVAEEVGGKGRRILMAQEQVDRAVIELTGTTTERQLAAVDRRYSRLFAEAKKAGADMTKLERAIAREKSEIWEREAQKAAQAIQQRTQAEGKVAEATKASTDATRKGGVELRSFKDVLKLGGTEARSFAGSLGSLATSGFGAAVAAIAIGTKLLGAYINKMNESRRANAQFLDEVHADRRGVRDLRAEVAALDSAKTDEELKRAEEIDRRKRDIDDLMHKLESLDEQIQAESALHGPEWLGGPKAKEMQAKKDKAASDLNNAKQELELVRKKSVLEEGRKFQSEIEALNRRNRLERNVLALDEQQEKFKRAHFEIEEKYLAILKDVTTEEQRQVFLAQKQLELENLQDRFTRDLSKETAKEAAAAAKETKQAGKERVREQRSLAEEVGKLELETLRENVRLSGGAQEDRLALLEAEQAAKLRQFDEHYTQLFLMAEENGFETTRLEEQFEVRREQLLKNHADEVRVATEDLGNSALEYAEVASSAFEAVARRVDRTTLSLFDLSDAQRKLLDVFRRTDMVMKVNDGRPLNSGLSDFEKMQRGLTIDPFAGAFVNPGPLMFGPSHGTSGGVRVNITNNGQPIAVKGATAQYGPNGIDIDLIVAEAIRRGGGETEAAIADTFDLNRAPR